MLSRRYFFRDNCSLAGFSHSVLLPHDARHAFASLALAAGKSLRWVAQQLDHANPELTLRVYAHALREEETELSFRNFGGTRTPAAPPLVPSAPIAVTPQRNGII